MDLSFISDTSPQHGGGLPRGTRVRLGGLLGHAEREGGLGCINPSAAPRVPGKHAHISGASRLPHWQVLILLALLGQRYKDTHA